VKNRNNADPFLGGEDAQISGRQLGEEPWKRELYITKRFLQKENPLRWNIEALHLLLPMKHDILPA
jgi:hypothetical protein